MPVIGMSCSITQLSAMSSLDVFFMLRQKPDDRMLREPDGSARILTAGRVTLCSTKMHAKYICPERVISEPIAHVQQRTERADLFNG